MKNLTEYNSHTGQEILAEEITKADGFKLVTQGKWLRFQLQL